MMPRKLSGLFNTALLKTPRSSSPAIHGTLRQAVVLQSPDPLFSEAVYILKNDTGLSRSELMEQARSAAELHCAGTLPQAPSLPKICFALLWFCLGCIITAMCIFIIL